MFVDTDDIKSAKSKLETRFLEAKTIKGTRQFHRFSPQANKTMLVYKTSEQTEDPQSVQMISDKSPTNEHIEILEISVNSYVSCVYDGKWWVGLIGEISDEYGDYKVKFMHPNGPTRQYYWPEKEDTCWVAVEDMLCLIETPLLTSSSSRKYGITKQNEDAIIAAFQKSF